MHCEVKELSSVAKELSFVVPAERVNAYWSRASQAVNQKAKLKGFRPGKVPQHLLERFYGAEINKKAAEKMTSEILFEALDERKITPVVQPRVSTEKVLSVGEDFSFKAHVEFLPEVELKTWQGLEAKLPERPVIDDALVTQELERLQTRMASFRPIEGRTVTQTGDYVDFNYVEACNHEGHGHDHHHDHKPHHRLIELGKGEFFSDKPEVEQALIGATVGQAVEAAGLTMTVDVIKECIKPALDDEFAKDLSDKFETLADLKADIESKLTEARTAQLETDKKQTVLDALIAANPLEIPETLVREQALEMASKQLGRFPKETAVQFWKAYGNSMLENLKPQAEQLLKAHLLLTAVAKDQNTDFDFDQMTQLVLERARLS